MRSAMSRRVWVPRPGSRRIARRERPLAQLVDAERARHRALRLRPRGYRFVALRLGGRPVIHPRIPSGRTCRLRIDRRPRSGRLDTHGRVPSSRAKELEPHRGNGGRSVPGRRRACGSCARRYEGHGGARRMQDDGPAPTHHAIANSAHAVGRWGHEATKWGRDTMFTPSIERKAPTMPCSRRLVLWCAALTFLIGAGVAFVLPGGGADGAAWALLVLAVACVTAFTATSEPTRRPSPACRATDASQIGSTLRTTCSSSGGATSRPARIRSDRVRASRARRA
jgi:hypothetical protein